MAGKSVFQRLFRLLDEKIKRLGESIHSCDEDLYYENGKTMTELKDRVEAPFSGWEQERRLFSAVASHGVVYKARLWPGKDWM